MSNTSIGDTSPVRPIIWIGLGTCIGSAVMYLLTRRRNTTPAPSPVKPALEKHSHTQCKTMLWNAIGGALTAASIYVGDNLRLYSKLPTTDKNKPVTAAEFSLTTGLNARWLREWLAQQASAGFIVAHSSRGHGALRFSIPAQYQDVLGNESSDHYNIGMIQSIPAVMSRIRKLPETFKTGIGEPYNDDDISEAIDRHHAVAFRTIFIPHAIPAVEQGRLHQMLSGTGSDAVAVADLGCGCGSLLLALARRYGGCDYHGYDISPQAIQIGRLRVSAEAQDMPGVRIKLHDADAKMESFPGGFDVVFTYDVLHDSTQPKELMRLVKRALKPDGIWVVVDQQCLEGDEENIRNNPGAATKYGFSLGICLSCGTSEADGLGLGTLGFNESIAVKMFQEEGFSRVQVLNVVVNGVADTSKRYFVLQH